jgi:DNA polymerase II small subunit
MMRDRILIFLATKDTLIAPEAMDYVLSKKEPIQYMESILDNIEEPPLILTLKHLQKVEAATRRVGLQTPSVEIPVSVIKKTVEKKPPVGPIIHFSSEEKKLDNFAQSGAFAKEKRLVCSVSDLPEGIKVLKDITGNSTCEGTIGDFKLYFNDRLKTLRKILKEKRQMVGVRELSRVKKADGTIKVIGMVSDIRITKNGHKLINLEDETDTISVLLSKDSGLVSDSTVLDEVIGIIGTKTKDGGLLLAQELVRPDIKVNRTQNRAKETMYAAFVSDIHVGSKTFLKDEFEDFLSWLSGNNGRMRDVAEKLRYIIVPGDTVDGIGIYPDQEEELAIDDIYGQYEELARLLSKVPERIQVIMLPGNHDAVRPAEPQPTFPDEIRSLFPQNTIFMGNPSYFSLKGVEVLAYHGRSMDDFIKALPSLDYGEAIKIMIKMLQKRHLVPIYGGRTPIAPEHKDYLVIDRIPDIFVTGHGHSTGMKKYRGVTLINASAWQSQTNFQKMHNFLPDPGKVPIFNLHTGDASIIDFS